MSLIILLAAIQAGSAVPARPVVQRAVERLDMTSFPNSLNNAGGPGRRTPGSWGGIASPGPTASSR